MVSRFCLTPWIRSQEPEDAIEPDTVFLGATDRCEAYCWEVANKNWNQWAVKKFHTIPTLKVWSIFCYLTCIYYIFMHIEYTIQIISNVYIVKYSFNIRSKFSHLEGPSLFVSRVQNRFDNQRGPHTSTQVVCLRTLRRNEFRHSSGLLSMQTLKPGGVWLSTFSYGENFRKVVSFMRQLALQWFNIMGRWSYHHIIIITPVVTPTNLTDLVEFFWFNQVV